MFYCKPRATCVTRVSANGKYDGLKVNLRQRAVFFSWKSILPRWSKTAAHTAAFVGEKQLIHGIRMLARASKTSTPSQSSQRTQSRVSHFQGVTPANPTKHWNTHSPQQIQSASAPAAALTQLWRSCSRWALRLLSLDRLASAAPPEGADRRDMLRERILFSS